jgi:hypothetical protein
MQVQLLPSPLWFVGVVPFLGVVAMARRSTAAMPKARAIAMHWLEKAKLGGMEAEVVLEFGSTVDQVTCCWRCGARSVERAHIVAASQGGTDDADNLLLLCHTCHMWQPDGATREEQMQWVCRGASWAEHREALEGACRVAGTSIEDLLEWMASTGRDEAEFRVWISWAQQMTARADPITARANLGIVIARQMKMDQGDLLAAKAVSRRLGPTGVTSNSRWVIELNKDCAESLTSGAISRRMNEKRQRGERVGTVPYGWELAADGVQLVEVAEEQAVLAIVRELRSAGLSMRTIAEELTKRGIPTKQGNRQWQHTSIRRIINRAPQAGLIQ